MSLAESGYFDGTSCHRLTTSGIYVLQCGDPTGTGTGDPGYKFGPVENAPTDDVYPAGTVAMARQGGDADSMGSQFFLVYEDSTIRPTRRVVTRCSAPSRPAWTSSRQSLTRGRRTDPATGPRHPGHHRRS